MTHFTVRSNLVTWAILWEKKENSGFFSETIAGCELKVGRYRQLIEFMSIEGQEIEGQGHFLTSTQGRLCMEIKTCFSQKPLGRY